MQPPSRSMPAAPVIHSVVVEPPNDREPFGSIAVTTNIPKDGGSGECVTPACMVAAPRPQQAWAAWRWLWLGLRLGQPGLPAHASLRPPLDPAPPCRDPELHGDWRA